MSVKAMTWAFEQDLPPAEKLVLLALADNCNDDDWVAWPKVSKIAAKASVSKRSAQRHLKALVERGVIEIVGGGGRLSNHYRLNETTGDNLAPVTTVSPQPCQPCHPSHDTAVTHNHNRTINEPSLTCRFEDFWNVFAHKVAKQEALKTWKRKKLDAVADEVIAGAARYAQARGEDPKYWKYPQGWLNAGRWADEDLPAFKPEKSKRDNQTEFLRGYVSDAEERTCKNVTSKIHSLALDGISDNGKRS